MKRKFWILSLFIFLTGCSMIETNHSQNIVDNNDSDLENSEIVKHQKNSDDFGLSGETKEIDKDSYLSNLFEKLSSYGDEIYNSKKDYTTYSKRNGAYFISLTDLKKDFNYDISMFKDEKDNLCDVDNSGILFDDDRKLGIEYLDDENPISVIIIGCQ